MAFSVSTKPKTVKWPVKVRHPSSTKPGHIAEGQFFMDMIILPKKQFLEIMEDESLSEVQRLRKFSAGWDLHDEDTNAVIDFNNDEQVAAVLEIPFMTPSITKAYLDCVSGGASRKN